MVRHQIRMGYGKSIPWDAGFFIDDDNNAITDFSIWCNSSQLDWECGRCPISHHAK